MKTLILAACLLVLVIPKGNAQDPDLFRTWQLTKVTIDNVDYVPEDYGYFPTLDLIDDTNEYFIDFATPTEIHCGSNIIDFQNNPSGFFIDQNNMICLAEVLCEDDPLNSPCGIIYGRHSEMYLEITSLLTYAITQNPDDTFSLEINNTEGNSAFYSSELLSNQDLKFSEITLNPNPTTNTLFISSENLEITSLSIFNFSGQKVIKNKEATSEIDVSTLQSGIYFLEINSEEGTAIKKFLKK
ncbi:MAG: hypothetical protein CMC14_07450 [Flavobacteriaceae bacterium]|nr:hypothetical protein [Flavobacteriaceae bacterium]|tara:strand:- start:389 stop:1114 length:726 start_codon:yes stop_codon:yes gene_type:complete